MLSAWYEPPEETPSEATSLLVVYLSHEHQIVTVIGVGITTTRQEQLISFIQYASWGASPESGT